MLGFNHSHQSSGQGNSKGNTNVHCRRKNLVIPPRSLSSPRASSRPPPIEVCEVPA